VVLLLAAVTGWVNLGVISLAKLDCAAPYESPAHASQTAYEAITLSAFLMLLMELVSLNSSDHEIREVLAEKDKRKLP
jgi:hypothetical protein